MSGPTRHSHQARLAEPALADTLLAGSLLYTSIQVVDQTGSTNADLLAAARSGAATGTVLVAEEQTAGRGRLDRSWQSEPGASLTFSVLLRPTGVPAASLGWLPLLTGVAMVSALRAQTGLEISLKWPNDVLAGAAGARAAGGSAAGGGAAGGGAAGRGGKLAGILAEQTGDAVVVGVGLNVSATESELPAGPATSLSLAGADDPDRQAILVALLTELERWYLRWSVGPRPGDAEACGLRASYLECCATIGRDVRVELPGGKMLTGRAADVDGVGRLLVNADDGVHAVSAGDVVHVR
ncbi:MAG TPA: biotin--[acetyl-CoA-carboxylase] ligase [Streptosporangiaceae bacterium]|jgi:BirA family biotin operon repressor/biotin-[acetyl-CoA-carboxylase] ligase|nr:biotin--[acetyl-CoA-carboxylase] ligase [Streptosporangiaceae bacterium]